MAPSRLGQVLKEVAADELLRERRSPLAEPEPRFASSPRGQGERRGLLQHPGQRAVVDAGVREEVLVLGREDGVPEDRRDFVVRHHAPVFPRQPDEHRALGVVHLTDRRGREANEGLDVRQPAAVEEDVVGEAHHGQEEQGQERHQAAGRATPPRGRQPCGRAAPGDADPRGRGGATVARPLDGGSRAAPGHTRSASRSTVSRLGGSAGFGEVSHRNLGFLPHVQSPRPSSSSRVTVRSADAAVAALFNAALGYGDPFPGPRVAAYPLGDGLSPHQPGFGAVSVPPGHRVPAISPRPGILDDSATVFESRPR